MKTVLGIDLGTTYSCMAYINGYGKPEVIPNADGDHTTPSVVWFDDNRVVVGEEAKGMATLCPNDVAAFVKREMGSESFRFACSFGTLRPEQVSAYVLKKLVKDASAALGEEIRDVVITCPAYFSFREREATKAAGTIAGLNVLEILNEPTAAAIAYGLSEKNCSGERNIIVYDLGGGTFDVTIINVSPNGINVVCTDGNHQLGGKDWDDRLIQILIDQFQRETGIMDDLYADPVVRQELIRIAERAKKALSQRAEVTENITYHGEKQRIRVTREAFEEATEALLAETVDFTRAAMDAARDKGVTHFDELILVGGSTRMPQVARILRDELGMEPKTYDPDEAVAKGAAIVGMSHALREEIGGDFSLEGAQGGSSGFSLEGEEKLRQVADENGFSLETLKGILTPTSNVCSKSFGQVLLRARDSQRRIFTMIFRNTNLPTEVSLTSLTVADNQPTVCITVVEGMEDMPTSKDEAERLSEDGIDVEEGVVLWEGDLTMAPNLPAESPVETVFKLDASGILHIYSRDPASGHSIEATIKTSSSIDPRDLDAMRKSMDRTRVE